MCGIAGTLGQSNLQNPDLEVLYEMIAQLKHRGPDESGVYLGDRIGMISARLSILDIGGGQQPISNEDETLWIVFNGEIFNYVELRPDLEARGHRFTTDTDTEVILHLFEEYGEGCVQRLNGQFAFAIWDEERESLFLARDRVGIRPLFYTTYKGRFLFASEIKALLAVPELRLEIDPERLTDLFTYWSPLPPHSIFREVRQVPPGHFMHIGRGTTSLHQYWSQDFSRVDESITAEDALEELRQLLIDATRIRLRADVPVGAYLSGGMDSSLIAALVRHHTDNPLDSFSIAFSDPQYDEASFQKRMADELGTSHQEVYCSAEDIGEVFEDVIWHTETPILRTSPAPMYLLSRRVRESGYKVVLTGEGADEFWAGYDIFKEMRIRRFWARQPGSSWRPQLFQKLYQDIPGLPSNPSYLTAFFGRGLDDTRSPYYSHKIRWENTARCLRFLDEGFIGDGIEPMPESPAIELPGEFESWSPLAQAQYLEIETFLHPYLLSSQGDRMGMANSVEGRFPFLDHRVIEFANQIPSAYKQLGLQEKWLLRKLSMDYLPEIIWTRTKRPYRAPIQKAFFNLNHNDYVSELLSNSRVRSSGYFKAEAVDLLVRKASSDRRLGEIDEMALVGILSTQILDDLYVRRNYPSKDQVDLSAVKVINRSGSTIQRS